MWEGCSPPVGGSPSLGSPVLLIENIHHAEHGIK